MCEYCDEERKRKFIINNIIVSLRITKMTDENVFEMLGTDKDNRVVKSFQPINYCPICGKNLNNYKEETYAT